jgi:tRNA (adenine22-N1)-methyltransferase
MARDEEPGRAIRLSALADLVPPGSRVADIGTDHALLPIRLLRDGRASFCVATEIRPALVRRTRARLRDVPWADRLELRTGDGLEVLAPEDRLNVLVLAGMGADTIRRILSHQRLQQLGVDRLVLQPQTDAAGLRAWLVHHRWRIVEEVLLRDGRRFTLLIAAETGHRIVIDRHPVLSRSDLLEAGPCLVRSGSPDVAAYWKDQLRRNRRILEHATGGAARDEAHRMCAVSGRILEALAPDRG